MKKVGKTLLIFVLLVALIIPISPVKTKASSVRINKTKAIMETDSTLVLKILGTSQSAKWSSNNKSIAKVTKKGKVTALKEGDATITAKVDGKKYTCLVTVVDSNKDAVNEKGQDEKKTKAIVKGDVLYEDSKIKISFYDIKIRSWDPSAVELRLLVVNNYKKMVEIQSDCATINGFSFNDITMSDEIAAGKSGTICLVIKGFESDLVDLSNIYNIGAELDVIVGGVWDDNSYSNYVSFDYQK